MSEKSKRSYLIWALLVLVVLVGAVTIFRSCVFPYPSYIDFVSRDKKFYADVAQACKALIAQASHPSKAWMLQEKGDFEKGDSEWDIQGEDESLPPIIQKIHSTKVRVGIRKRWGDFVVIMVGVSRPGYGVRWSQNSYGNGQQRWELTVNGDGLGSVVYSEP